VKVRPASTLLLVRDGESGIEVVMGHRPPGGPFGDVWVFPGGVVEDGDLERAGTADEAWELAAVRETAEEVGILITRPESVEVSVSPGTDLYGLLDEVGAVFDTARLVYLSNWVTPRMVPKRFDTRFYLCAVHEAVAPAIVTDEFVSVDWIDVGSSLAAHRRREMPMIFPTVAHLRYVAAFPDVASLVAEARALDVIPQIEPRMFERGDHVELVVTGDPRFNTP
jgi:8-oxo-dGTP pyrophosphatase MutT (NUDIX family)